MPVHFIAALPVDSAYFETYTYSTRRGDRAADCAALEMLCGGNSTGGSNPPLSAGFGRRQSNLGIALDLRRSHGMASFGCAVFVLFRRSFENGGLSSS